MPETGRQLVNALRKSAPTNESETALRISSCGHSCHFAGIFYAGRVESFEGVPQ